MVYLYGMQAFALAMVVDYTVLESCTIYRKLTAVSMLGAFLDVSYTTRFSKLVSWSAWQKRRTATQPHSHKAPDHVSSDRLQLSCFKQDVQGFFV
jgi:hypothetical protein